MVLKAVHHELRISHLVILLVVLAEQKREILERERRAVVIGEE